MKSTNRSLLLWLAITLTGLMGGCSSGGHSAASRSPEPSPPTAPSDQVYLAQAAGTCWNSMSCCIQNHPFTFVESCGADPFEAARILEALGQFEAAARAMEAAGQKEPSWKKGCRRNYNKCINDGWVGTWNCVDCFRFCEGQQGKWPEDRCFPANN